MNKFTGSFHNLAALHDASDSGADVEASFSTLSQVARMSRASLDEAASSKRMVVVANHLPLRAVPDGAGGHTFEWDEDSLIGQAKEGIDPSFEVIFVGSLPVDVPPETQDRLAEQLLASNKCLPVYLEPELRERFYKGFCKQQLWPLLHYVLPMSPHSLGRFNPDFWQSYVRANMIFADRLTEVVRQHCDFVWIHDYHLMVLPSLLRRRLHKVAVGIFLHSAFPSSEIFRAFPKREELLRSLLNADVIGFHTFDYARHFISCCSRMLGLEHYTKRGSILMNYYGRAVHLKILPTCVKPQRYLEGFQWPDTKWRIGELTSQLHGKTVLLGLDDMDQFKGIEMKFLAFERVLEYHEEWRGKLVLVQVTSPPRSSSQEVQELAEFVRTTADRINKRYGNPAVNYTPLMHVEQAVPLHDRLAYFAMANAVVVTATRDGMNLVPYEYIVCRQGTPGLQHRTSMLVVSEFVGCSPSLSGALRVNPWSITSIADGIYAAIKTPVAEQVARHEKHWAYVRDHTVGHWSKSYTSYLVAATEGHDHMKTYSLGLGLDTFRMVALDPSFRKLDMECMLQTYKASSRRLILCDYDGTLVPSDTTDMQPSADIKTLLRSLAEHHVFFIVSGRVCDEMQPWFADVPEVGIACEHGFRIKEPSSAAYAVQYPGLDFAWKEIVRPIMRMYAESTDGTHVQEKACGMTWAYAAADPDFGRWQAKELVDHLESVMIGEAIEIVSGHLYVEVKPKGLTKGATVTRLFKAIQPDFVLCLGDDRSDEEMFNVFNEQQHDATVYACTVGQKPSQAHYYVNDSKGVVTLLSQLIAQGGIEFGAGGGSKACEDMAS